MTSLEELGVITPLGPVRAHVAPVALEIADLWVLRFIWGAPGRGTGDHARGVALDFMTYASGTVSKPTDLRSWVGNQIAAYLLAHRVRLNVSYVIWNRRIASALSNPPWTWRAYSGSNPHTDHVHVSFRSSGTYQPPEDDMSTPAEIAAAVREELADELAAIASFDVEAYRDTTAKLNTFFDREKARDEAIEARELARDEALAAAIAELKGGGEPQ